mgnify:CR=1 FL=1
MTEMVYGTVSVRDGEPVLPKWWRTVDKWTMSCILMLFGVAMLFLGLPNLFFHVPPVPVPDLSPRIGGDLAGLRVGVPTDYFFDVIDDVGGEVTLGNLQVGSSKTRLRSLLS